MLTQQRLTKLLNYDPATGDFTWLVRTSRRVKVGDIAGHFAANGYRHIGIDGKVWLAHRLTWLYMTGDFPVDQIDHINGVKADNRFCNLREATGAENQQNLPLPIHNKSGFMGVSWSRERRKWSAYIQIAGRTKYIGRFSTAESAHAAYLAAKARLHTFQPVPRDFNA